MTRYAPWLAAALLASSIPASATGAYPAVAANPTYAQAAALDYRPHNVKIAYGDDPSQYGLLWLPEGSAGTQAPLVVLVHGGCWLSAYGIEHTFPLATALARRGHPVWNVEYRRSGETGGGWPHSYEDIRRAIRAIPLLARHGVATDPVILLGHSAGGHLALLAASDWAEIFPPPAPRVVAVGLAAITDLKQYAAGDNSCQQAAPAFMGGAPAAAASAYSAANPAERGIAAPVTLLQGELDPIVPLEQLHRLPGPGVTRHIEAGAGHFDWIHPGTPAFRTLVETLRDISTPQS